MRYGRRIQQGLLPTAVREPGDAIADEDYLANQEKLAANRTNAGARPPREGTALCQGIVFCGACGRSMQVRYQDHYPRYECSHSRADHVATPLCGSVRADTIDAAAADALLAAVAPEQVSLPLAAAGEVTARRQRSVRVAGDPAERVVPEDPGVAAGAVADLATWESGVQE